MWRAFNAVKTMIRQCGGKRTLVGGEECFFTHLTLQALPTDF